MGRPSAIGTEGDLLVPTDSPKRGRYPDLVGEYGSHSQAGTPRSEAFTENTEATYMTVEVEYEEDGFVRPKTKFVYEFPASVEARWQGFDDAAVQWCQSFRSKFWDYLSLFFTMVTNVEVALPIPFMLYVLGKDNVATLLMYYLFALTFISQLPKRFLWRTRPYLANRARKVRKDKTSSFPSRAVTCAVVYSIFMCVAYHITRPDESVEYSSAWMSILVLFMLLGTSFSRMYFGVHYPTDCLGGIIQGLVIVGIGQALYKVDVDTCAECDENMPAVAPNCYRTGIHAFTWENTDQYDVGGAIGISAFALILTIVSVLKPLEFWKKCHHAYGMLFAALMFRLTLLCPKLSQDENSALDLPLDPTLRSVLWSFLFVITGTGLGMYCRKWHSSIVAFVVIFAGFYIALLSWRFGL